MNFFLFCGNVFLLKRAISSHNSCEDAMLSMAKVEVDLICDVAMYLYFPKGMRGGVSYF